MVGVFHPHLTASCFGKSDDGISLAQAFSSCKVFHRGGLLAFFVTRVTE